MQVLAHLDVLLPSLFDALHAPSERVVVEALSVQAAIAADDPQQFRTLMQELIDRRARCLTTTLCCVACCVSAKSCLLHGTLSCFHTRQAVPQGLRRREPAAVPSTAKAALRRRASPDACDQETQCQTYYTAMGNERIGITDADGCELNWHRFRGPGGARLLQRRGGLVVRKLAARLGGRAVLSMLSSILEDERDLPFAAALVQALNLILLTAPEVRPIAPP